MKLRKKLFEAFHTYSWNVAFRNTNVACFSELLSGKTTFDFISAPKNNTFCFADPLIFSESGKNYYFVEAINRKTKKGEIGLLDFFGKRYVYKPLIVEDFHMSFPYVFVYNNEHYMIPETRQANQLIVYKASAFPYQWHKYKVLMDNCLCVDTSVFFKGECLFLVTYCKNTNTLVAYKLDENFNLYAVGSIEDIECVKRGAGRVVDEGNNKYIRPSQICSQSYGEGIIFNELIVEETGILERELTRLTIENCRINGKKLNKYNRVHTQSFGNGLEMIDYLAYSFSLKQFWKTLRNKFERMKK